MNRSWHHLWTWLSVALYGAMVLAIQAFHTHDGGGCATCGCVLSERDVVRDAPRTDAAHEAAEDESDSRQGRPFSPHEEDCPACQFVSQPKALTAVISPPELSDSFEIAEFSHAPLHLAPAWDIPPARGPPAL